MCLLSGRCLGSPCGLAGSWSQWVVFLPGPSRCWRVYLCPPSLSSPATPPRSQCFCPSSPPWSEHAWKTSLAQTNQSAWKRIVSQWCSVSNDPNERPCVSCPLTVRDAADQPSTHTHPCHHVRVLRRHAACWKPAERHCVQLWTRADQWHGMKQHYPVISPLSRLTAVPGTQCRKATNHLFFISTSIKCPQTEGHSVKQGPFSVRF